MSAQPGVAPVQPAAGAPAAPAGRHVASDPRDVLARPLAATSLLDAVQELRRDVAETRFPLAIPGTERATVSRDRLLDQLTEHLVPRIRELSAPAVVVVSGSTGAGKSTLVNSLVEREVSAAGVLRPTTRQPVLVHHPLDGELLAGHPLMEVVRTVVDDAVPRGIALLDAPDLDSVLESNRESAHRLLEAADLWLFVTTAARYGDALPWRVLESAVERGATIAMVLNRVPAESMPTIRGDLLARLRLHGLQGAPLFVVPDLGPHEGLLAPAVVAPVQRWLRMLAGPDRARTVVGRTLRGSLAALRGWVDELADAVQAQADAAATIGAALDVATQAPAARAAEAVRSGAVADGAVRARWAALRVPKGPLASLTRRSGRVRAGRGRARRARETAVEQLLSDLTSSAAAVLTAAGAHTAAALRADVTGPDGPPGGDSFEAMWSDEGAGGRRAATAEQAARAWVAEGARMLNASLVTPPGASTPDGGKDKRRARAIAALGAPVVAAIALTAAAGVDDAASLLEELVGPSAAQLVEALRGDLEARASAQVGRERADAGHALADPDLAADASSRLRLRLAVLKGLT